MPRVAAVVSLLFAVFAPAAQAAPGDIIVQRDPGLTRSERAAIRADADVRLVRTLPIAGTELVHPQAGHTVGAALSELRADDDVVYAEADRPAHVETADTFWNSLWGLEQSSDADIDAAEAWAKSSGAGVAVGVVDTGVLFSHTDLAGQLAGNPGEQGAGRESNGVDDDHNGLVDDFQGWDFVYDDNTPEDGHGHGTHVSGTIAAVENTTGVVGVAPAAKVMPIRALDETGSGSMSGVAAAFSYAGDQGLRVVNASLGGGYSTTVHDAIASHPNTLYVVAAGNDAADDDDPNLADYPCAYDLANIVCVGATDRYDEPATFSNYGRTSVDLSAPGVGIISTWNTGTTAYKSLQGTSMATPHVAGAAALALAAQPAASTAQVRSALLSSVDVKPSLSGLSVTGGRLNADAAVDAMLGVAPDPAPTGTPTPTPPVSTPPPPPVEAPVTTPTPPVSAPVTPAPVLRHVTIVRRHGKLRVTFSLSRAASVRLTVARRGTARAARSWTVRGRAGANSYSLTGRVPRRAGAYTLSVRLDAAVARAGFKVTR